MRSFYHQFSGRLFFVKIMLLGALFSYAPGLCQAADDGFEDLEDPASLRREQARPFVVSLVDSLVVEEVVEKKNNLVRIDNQEIRFVKLDDSLRKEATKSLRQVMIAAEMNDKNPILLPLISYFKLLDKRNRTVEKKIIPAVNDRIARLTESADSLELENESLKQENESLKEEIERLKNLEQQPVSSIPQPYPHPVGRWTPWGWLFTLFGWNTQPKITN